MTFWKIPCLFIYEKPRVSFSFVIWWNYCQNVKFFKYFRTMTPKFHFMTAELTISIGSLIIYPFFNQGVLRLLAGNKITMFLHWSILTYKNNWILYTLSNYPTNIQIGFHQCTIFYSNEMFCYIFFCNAFDFYL